MLAVMSAIEHLLKTTDFKPKRTIILGFGSDEERGGQVGAPAIARYLLDKYGRNSMALCVIFLQRCRKSAHLSIASLMRDQV